MADTAELCELMQHYAFRAKSGNGNDPAPCTVHELNNAINETTRIFNAVIRALESE